jgi:lysozyme family protein
VNAEFLLAWKMTLGHEVRPGGDPLSDVATDRGGLTKFGISQKSHPGLDIKNLTLEQAQEIAYNEHWKFLRLDEVKSGTIQREIFDTSYNCGPAEAGLIIQKALNFLGEKLVEDCVVGSKTIERINFWTRKDVEVFFKCLNGFQFMAYVKIVQIDRTQIANSRGWMKRIQSYWEEKEKTDGENS